MKWYVYFLRSLIKKNWIYVGSTNDLERRLKEHNSKKVLATKAYLPYSMIYTEQFDNEYEARQRERYFKYWKGRIEKKKILNRLLK